jgi:hypothetical protein
MNQYTNTFAAFVFTIFAAIQTFGQNLNQFYYEESNALHWQQRYATAPTGSWEEQQARQQRDMAIERAIQNVSYYSFQGMHWSQIESFADQMNQKFSAAPSGGAIERMYRQVRDTSYQAFNTELQRYVQYFSNEWRQIHDLALQMDQKYSAAPTGSQKERAYDQARRTAYQRMPQSVDQELYRLYSFRDVERLAEYFTQLYSAAPTGSLKENTYNQIRRSAFNQALQKFNEQAYSMPQHELWQIQEEYNRRYSAAPTGSLQETYFRQIRDAARNSIRP